MIAAVSIHKGIRLSSVCEGSRVQYTISSNDRDLGSFVRYIPEEMQSFQLDKLSWLFGDFFGREEVSHG